MKLATITDIHHGPPASGHAASQKLTDLGLPLLQRFIEGVKGTDGIDGVINLGDFVEHSPKGATADLGTFSEVVGEFRGLECPVLHAIGNHDLIQLSEQAVANVLGQQRLYYSTDIGEHHLVVLLSRTKQRDGSEIFVSAEQLTWLEDDLRRTEKPTIVAVHHPLSDQDLSSNIWFAKHPHCALVQNRDEVRSILQQSGKVIAVLNGHTHWNQLDVHDGIPYVTQQSLIENVGNNTPANAHGLVTLKGAQFGMELFGNNPFLSHADVVRETTLAYDSIADAYRRETAQYGQAERDEFDALLPLAHLGDDPAIIDFGCGPARDAGHFQSRGFRYIGVENSTSFIQHARAAVPDGTFYQGDFAEVNLPRGVASVAWHSSTLQHVKREALPAVLSTAFEALKPGGLFYAHYRAGAGESIQISSEYGRPIARFIALYEESEMNHALEQAGFEVLKSWTFDHQYSGLKGQTVKYKSKVIARKPL